MNVFKKKTFQSPVYILYTQIFSLFFVTPGSDSIGPTAPGSSGGDSSMADMDVVPASTMIGGIVAASGPGGQAPGMAPPGGMPGQMGMMPGQIPGMMMAGGVQPMPGAAGATGAQGGKKEKKKKEKKFIRLAANTTWEDPTLSEWAQGELFYIG